jgi:ketosteroid isomerase-like protein
MLASILAACSAPAPAPIAIPASATITASKSTADDPAAVVQGFWDAITAKNIDAAMAFVADDVKFSGDPFNGSDRAQFAASMSSGVVTFVISDLKADSGDTVTFNYKTLNSIGYIRDSGTAQFQVNNEGKIFLMKFH